MSLSHHDGKNSGTFKQLHIIKQSAATFPYPPALQTDLDYTDDITTSEDWLTITPLPNSGRWEETPGEEMGEYNYTIELVLNKDSRAITELLATKAKFKLLALVEDHNEVTRLIGSDEHFCFLTYSLVKERGGVSQPNLYTVRITCTMAHPAVYYTGDYTTS